MIDFLPGQVAGILGIPQGHDTVGDLMNLVEAGARRYRIATASALSSPTRRSRFWVSSSVRLLVGSSRIQNADGHRKCPRDLDELTLGKAPGSPRIGLDRV